MQQASFIDNCHLSRQMSHGMYIKVIFYAFLMETIQVRWRRNILDIMEYFYDMVFEILVIIFDLIIDFYFNFNFEFNHLQNKKLKKNKFSYIVKWLEHYDTHSTLLEYNLHIYISKLLKNQSQISVVFAIVTDTISSWIAIYSSCFKLHHYH